LPSGTALPSDAPGHPPAQGRLAADSPCLAARFAALRLAAQSAVIRGPRAGYRLGEAVRQGRPPAGGVAMRPRPGWGGKGNAGAVPPPTARGREAAPGGKGTAPPGPFP